MVWKPKGHASLKIYLKIIIALAVITVTEIAVPYTPGLVWNSNNMLAAGTLGVLAVAKYALVVAFFMHLYYDSPLCTFLFGSGMVLAGGTIIALIHLFPPRGAGHAGTTTPGASASPGAVAAGPKLTPEQEAGRKLVATNCAACHTVESMPDVRGVVGPSLDGIAVRGGTRIKGMSAEAYIEQSIKDPNAFIAPGYPPGMQQFSFSDSELKTITAFLMTLKNEGGSK